jgi:hypothetical protein
MCGFEIFSAEKVGSQRRVCIGRAIPSFDFSDLLSLLWYNVGQVRFPFVYFGWRTLQPCEKLSEVRIEEVEKFMLGFH